MTNCLRSEAETCLPKDRYAWVPLQSLRPREHSTPFVLKDVQTVVPHLPLCHFFSILTTQDSLSLLMGHDCRSFTPRAGCGQVSSWREQLSPPSFSNHSSVDTPLDHSPFLVLQVSQAFHIQHVLEIFPFKLGFFLSSVQARHWESLGCLSKPPTDTGLILYHSWNLPSTPLLLLSQAPSALAWMMLSA